MRTRDATDRRLPLERERVPVPRSFPAHSAARAAWRSPGVWAPTDSNRGPRALHGARGRFGGPSRLVIAGVFFPRESVDRASDAPVATSVAALVFERGPFREPPRPPFSVRLVKRNGYWDGPKRLPSFRVPFTGFRWRLPRGKSAPVPRPGHRPKAMPKPPDDVLTSPWDSSDPAPWFHGAIRRVDRLFDETSGKKANPLPNRFV